MKKMLRSALRGLWLRPQALGLREGLRALPDLLPLVAAPQAQRQRGLVRQHEHRLV